MLTASIVPLKYSCEIGLIISFPKTNESNSTEVKYSKSQVENLEQRQPGNACILPLGLHSLFLNFAICEDITTNNVKKVLCSQCCVLEICS